MDGPLEGGRAGSRSPGYRQAAYRGGSSPPGATRHKWPFGCDTDGQLPEHQHVDVGDLICDRPTTRGTSGSSASTRSVPWSTARSAIRGAEVRSTSPARSLRSRPSSCLKPAPTSTSPGSWRLGPWRKNEPPAAWRGCQYAPGQATRRAAGLPDTAAGPGRRDIRSSDAAGDRQARGDPELPAT